MATDYKNWETFESFLREKGVYEKYMDNYNIAWSGFNIETFKRKTNLDFSTKGFKLSSSNEGYFFWQPIVNEWNEIINT